MFYDCYECYQHPFSLIVLYKMSSSLSLQWTQSFHLYTMLNCRDADTPDPPRLTTWQQTRMHRSIVDFDQQKQK